MIDFDEARTLFLEYPDNMFMVTYRPTDPDIGPLDSFRIALKGAVMADFFLSTDIIEKVESF